MLRLAINLGLLLSGIVMSFSGFLIQFRFHMGHNTGTGAENTALGLNYHSWTAVHKISVIIVSIFMVFHFMHHRKWYKTIISKKLAAKNKLQIALTIVFILVAVTGYIPWLIDLAGGPEFTRKFFIEIHDKITLILFVILTIHVAGRLKWYFTSINRLGEKRSI